MSSLSVPCTNVIQLHRQESDLNQQKLTLSPQEEPIIEQNTATVDQQPPIQPIEILIHQRQRHPHRQYQQLYSNPNHFQYFGTEIVRLRLNNWVVNSILYNESLRKYLTIQEFTKRIKEFNATSRRLQFYQLISWLLFVITSAFIFSLVNSENKIIYGAASLVSISIAFIYYWFFIRNGKLQTKYLNKLIRRFNKDDVSKNIYWKLVKTGNDRTTQFYLSIELSRIRSASIYEKKNIPDSSVIYDYDLSSDSPNLNDIYRSNFVSFGNDVENVNVDNTTNTTKDNMDGVDNSRLNANNNDDDDDDYDDRHQSINLSDSVTSTELLSTRVSIEDAQIQTAIRTRPYELKLPSYYEITKSQSQ